MKQWSISEEKFIQNNYPKQSIRQISLCLNRSFDSVRKKIESLGIKERSGIYWKDYETLYLKDNYKCKSYTEMAFDLKRTKMAIKAKCEKLGLKKRISRNEIFDKIANKDKC